jgi:long-chain acyl-CoA synthetase
MCRIVALRHSGPPSHVDLGAIEAHYRQSPFIADVCVFSMADGKTPSEGLHAVVVPDAPVLRQRKIVNVRELIRFEIEGLSLSLPHENRVSAFDITMHPLPRDSGGAPDRLEVHDRYRGGRLRTPPHGGDVRPDDHTACVVDQVQAILGSRASVRAWSNLELDLGLDSIERVELMAALEQRFGTRIPDEIAQGAFVVGDLAAALRGAAVSTEAAAVSWRSLLEPAGVNRCPDAAAAAGAAHQRELQALLRRRMLTAASVYGLVQGLRALIRPRASGLEHLPRAGAFILAPNHQSYIDPLLLECVLPFRIFRRLFFVGAAEYFETPLTKRLARGLNIVPVDPDANLLRAMQAGAFGLRHGKVLVLFPEGERSIDGTVKPFRKGAAILSRHLAVPIVPVAINGVFEIWPRNRSVDWRRLLPRTGHRVSIRFGRPLVPPQADTSDGEHTAALRARVESMWLEAEASRS